MTMTLLSFNQELIWAEKVIQEAETGLEQHQSAPVGAAALKKQLQATRDFVTTMRALLVTINPKKKVPKSTGEQMTALVKTLKRCLIGVDLAKPWVPKWDYYVFEDVTNPNEQFFIHSPDPASLPPEVTRESKLWLLVDAWDRDSYDADTAARIDSEIAKKGYHASVYGVTME